MIAYWERLSLHIFHNCICCVQRLHHSCHHCLALPLKVMVTYRISELYSEDLDPRSLAVNRQAFDDEFFKDAPSSSEPEPTVLSAWNKSPMLVDLQLHTHKHRRAVSSVSFKVDKVELMCVCSIDVNMEYTGSAAI